MNTFNTRSMSAVRRIDTHDGPQTVIFHRAHRTRDNAYRRRAARTPWIDWRNPIEVSALCCAAIGIAVMVGMWVGVL